MRHDVNFKDLTLNILNNDQHWSILADLNRARSFDFDAIIEQSIPELECSDFLETIQKVGFPRKELLTCDVIATNAKCFRLVHDRHLSLLLPNNPMKSRFFSASQWNINHIRTFLLRESLTSAPDNINMRWNAWCSELSVEFLIEYKMEWMGIYWKKLNIFGIEGIQNKQAARLVLDFISPIEEFQSLSTSFSTVSRRSLLKYSSMLIKLPPIQDQRLFYSDFQVNFAKEQVMKILLISTYFKSDIMDNVIHSHALSTLSSYLNLLTRYENSHEKKFPLRRTLLKYLRIIMDETAVPIDHQKDVFEKCLIKFVDFLDFDSNAILNVLFLWKSKNYDSSSGAADAFEAEMVKKIFDVKGQATVENTCFLLQYFKLKHYRDARHLQNVNLHFYLGERNDLSRGVLNTCPLELPSQYKKHKSVIPLKDRLNFSLKFSRDLYGKWGFQIILSPIPGVLCISVMQELLAYMRDWENPHFIFPLNLIVYYQIVQEDSEIATFIYGNLRTMLALFFKNLLETPKWFITTGTDSMTHRPIIYPNIHFPPQLMELIGILLGKSSIIPGFQVPFLLDRNYFAVSEQDALNSVYSRCLPFNSSLDSIKKRLKYSLYEVMKNFNELGEFVYESSEPSNQLNNNAEASSSDGDSACSDLNDQQTKTDDHKVTLLQLPPTEPYHSSILPPDDVSIRKSSSSKRSSLPFDDPQAKKIISDTVAMGRQRLWHGLEASVETNFLSKEHLYELIFYNKN